jgi:hypothetical protein
VVVVVVVVSVVLLRFSSEIAVVLSPDNSDSTHDPIELLKPTTEANATTDTKKIDFVIILKFKIVYNLFPLYQLKSLDRDNTLLCYAILHCYSKKIYSLFFVPSLLAQRFKDIIIQVDSSGFGKNNLLYVTAKVVKKNEDTLLFSPNPDVSRPWWRLVCLTNYWAVFSKGKITNNDGDLCEGNHTLKLSISNRGKTISKTIELKLPYVKALAVKDDSICENYPMRLHYSLLMSNGAEVPPNPNLFNETLLTFRSISHKSIFYRDGFLTVGSAHNSTDSLVELKITDSRRNVLLAEKKTKLNYPVFLSANYSGGGGQTGQHGKESWNSRWNPSNQLSRNGIAGSDGLAGLNGADIKVLFTKKVINNKPLLFIKLLNKDNAQVENYTLSLTDSPQFFIATAGGNGGKGSSGESGYIDTAKKINRPIGGDGSKGGNAGKGGNGGSLLFYTDSTGLPHFTIFSVHTKGGYAGQPGEGGSKGRGAYENASFVALLFGVNGGRRGQQGNSANDGLNGRIEVVVLKEKTFDLFWQNPFITSAEY